MKKITRVILILAVLTVGCGNNASTSDKDAVEPQESTVTVKGKLENGNGKELLIMRFEKNNAVMLDTAVIGSNGEFEFKLNVPRTDFYKLAADRQNGALLILSPGQTLEITGNYNDLSNGLSVKGSKDTELLWSYYHKVNGFGNRIQEIKAEINTLGTGRDAEKQKLIDEYNSINKAFVDYTKEFIETNASSPAVIPVLGNLDPESDLKYFEIARDGLKPTFSSSPYYQNLDKTVEGYKRRNKAAGAIAPGKPAPEITGPDPNGKMRSLSDLKGKVVLIDFWASWCSPCRRENPNVVRLYKKYKDDGFEVFSVSLDKTKDRWVKAIQADGLVWENHVSDLKYWQSELSQPYNVTSIPFTVLVDRDGNIIATKLRGSALEAKLKEIFGH